MSESRGHELRSPSWQRFGDERPLAENRRPWLRGHSACTFRPQSGRGSHRNRVLVSGGHSRGSPSVQICYARSGVERATGCPVWSGRRRPQRIFKRLQAEHHESGTPPGCCDLEHSSARSCGPQMAREAAARRVESAARGAMAMVDSNERLGPMRRQLSDEELDHVSGGFKWDRNHVSSDVIDARGGQFQLLWWTFTLDVNGKISSIS